MKNWMSRAALWVVTPLLLFAVACGGEEPTTPELLPAVNTPSYGGTFVMGSISDIDSWNEYLSQQSFSSFLLRRVYLRLAEQGPGPLDHPDGFKPSLATSWQAAEDGKSITFTLREMSWSDGEPFSASDVRFTWLAQTSEYVPWIGAQTKTRITDVEVLDPLHVRFHFDEAYPYQFVDAVEGGIIPQHIFGEIPFENWKEHDWSQARVGSGPFLPAVHRPGQEIVLERNPNYYRDGLPYLDRVVVRVVPDVTNLVTQLRAGEIDYVDNVPQRDAMRLDREASIEVVPFQFANYEFIGWNGAKAPFNDAEVRRALTMAIDRQALIDELMGGHGQVGSGPAPSIWWGAANGLSPLPYDPEAAREILRAKGFTTAEGEAGETLSLSLLTNAGNRNREDALVKIQAQLARVGIEATLEPLEMRTMRGRVVSGEFDGYLGGWVFSGKVELQGLFGSQSAPPNGMNIVSYSNHQVDSLFQELEGVDGWQAMAPILNQIQHQIAADQPYSFLYEAQRVAAHSDRLQGVRIDVPSDPLQHLADYWVR